MDNREQAIKQVAEAIGAPEYDVVNGLVHDENFTQGDLAARYAVHATERVLELMAALREIARGGAYGLTEAECIDAARAALQPKAMEKHVNYMHRAGASSCIRCDFKTNAADSYEKQDAAIMAHLTEKHPNWMTEGVTINLAQRLQTVGEPERVSDEILAEIASWRNFGDADQKRAMLMARELRELRAQIAEKDAAIEKARRDALEEAAKVADREWAKHDDVPRCATAIRIERAIRALAAQKKEG